MSNPHYSRRRFVKSTSATLGAGLVGGVASGGASQAASPSHGPPHRPGRLPREVWVATVAQLGMQEGNYQEMSRSMLERMEQLVPLQPDIICLPELFPFSFSSQTRTLIKEVAETPIGTLTKPFAQFAAQHDCYVVCPIYTQEAGHFYNAAVLIDRRGELVGEYRKMHPTCSEMDEGVSPGPVDPPVFTTDFGKVGLQICFDIQWQDGWQKLQEAGAEMVFWPSAYAGGSAVNTMAWQNRYCVVSSTRKGSSKICDIAGQELARSNPWQPWACTAVNLEKELLCTWPYVKRFDAIRSKYGRKVLIQTMSEEEWTIIESRSPEIRVADLLEEFELKTYAEHLALAAEQQQR